MVDRAGGGRRPGRHEFADPQLPRLRPRGQREPARVRGVPAGVVVRHHVPVHAAAGSRRSTGDDGSCGSPTAAGDRPHRDHRHRRHLPAARRPELEQLLGRGVFYGAAVPRRRRWRAAGHRRRRRQLRRPGRAAPRPVGRAGHDAGPVGQRLPGACRTTWSGEIASVPNVDVRYRSQVVDAVGNDYLGAVVVEDVGTGKRDTMPTSGLFALIGSEPKTDWARTTVASRPVGLPRHRDRAARPGGRAGDDATWPLDRPPPCSRPACPACSPSATSVAARSSGSPRRSARAPSTVQLVHSYLQELERAGAHA